MPVPSILLLWALAAVAPAGEGASFAFVPPQPFRPETQLPLDGTLALSPALRPEAERRLLAVYSEGSGADASFVAVSEVAEDFDTGANPQRDQVAAAAVAHFQRKLDLELRVDRVEHVAAPAPRVEVLGRCVVDGVERVVRLAFFGGQGRHGVVLVSASPARYAALEEKLGAALDGVAPLPAMARGHAPALRALAFGLVGVALALAIRAAKRRKS